MDVRKRLLRYCPRPKKRGPRFITQLIAKLQIPKLIESFHLSLPLGWISFFISVITFIAGSEIVYLLMFGFPIGLDSTPFLILLMIVFIEIGVCIHSLLLKMKQKGNRVLIATIALLTIIPSGFAAGLNYGIFDSVVLLNDSTMDLSYCTAWLTIKNNGLTDVQISKVQLGNLICNVSFRGSPTWRMNLERGENATLGINYVHKKFTWGRPILSEYIIDSGLEFASNLEITPTTFREGKCPVVIYTDGLIAYKFEIEAKFSKTEEIYGFQARVDNLGQGRVGNQDYCLPDIWFKFEMAPSSVAFVYSVDIGNLIIKFNPPVFVKGEQWYNDFSLYLNPEYINVMGDSSRDATPSQPLNLPIFRVGETYNVTVRTMANNNYTTFITMTE